MKAKRGGRSIVPPTYNLGARKGGWLTPQPGQFTPGKETKYPLYKRLRSKSCKLNSNYGLYQAAKRNSISAF
jgi:hypothetical protein